MCYDCLKTHFAWQNHEHNIYTTCHEYRDEKLYKQVFRNVMIYSRPHKYWSQHPWFHWGNTKSASEHIFFVLLHIFWPILLLLQEHNSLHPKNRPLGLSAWSSRPFEKCIGTLHWMLRRGLKGCCKSLSLYRMLRSFLSCLNITEYLHCKPIFILN